MRKAGEMPNNEPDAEKTAVVAHALSSALIATAEKWEFHPFEVLGALVASVVFTFDDLAPNDPAAQAKLLRMVIEGLVIAAETRERGTAVVQ